MDGLARDSRWFRGVLSRVSHIGEFMETVASVMRELKKKSNPLRVQAFAPHGAPADMFGVSVADMKVIARKIKGNQELALGLFETGNADAMYLAGLVADGSTMSRKLLDSWAKKAPWQMVSEHTIPMVASHSRYACDLAMKWIRSRKESIASSGWSTYAGIVSITADDELTLDEIKLLLKRVETGIDSAHNRVRYTMNGFVIAVGTYVLPLVKHAVETAREIGKVNVDMHGTTCKVPLATEYIAKVERSGRTGRKRKSLKR
ncbi:MAG: DNA alkylation repair protein [Planctomycetota bacterium]